MTSTTRVATMLNAGHAENALPQSATATVNCRIFPGVEVADVRTTLQRIADDDAVEIRIVRNPGAGPASPLRQDVLAAVTKAVHTLYPGTPVIPSMAPYASDGTHTGMAGIPTCGVMGIFMREDDDFSHGLNERVPVRALFGALEYWHVMLHELAAP